LQFVPSNPPTKQWTRLLDLPEEGRAGGSLHYITSSNSLLYTTGAHRPYLGLRYTVDHNTTWQYYFDQPTEGWIQRRDLPYMGNHVSSVAGVYQGVERYVVFGGQKKENEPEGNQDHMFEWNDTTKLWTPLKKLTLARGHASTSTIKYKCGIITAGGAINLRHKTSDISFYSFDTDTWSKIGDLPQIVNTPVCDVVYDYMNTRKDYLYCQTGPVNKKFSWRVVLGN
jgi:hypothetical protein